MHSLDDIHPQVAGDTEKTAKIIFIMDQLSLFTVPVVYALATSAFLATYS